MTIEKQKSRMEQELEEDFNLFKRDRENSACDGQDVLMQKLKAEAMNVGQPPNSIMISNEDNSNSIRHHSLNPSLFEVTASQIAHYLFPNNFAAFKFIIKPDMDVNGDIEAGYLSSAYKLLECGDSELEGIENVYAVAFYLGLEIRSHQCMTLENKTYLFIDDFSHPFHEIDIEHKALIEEYRDHKINPSEPETLFPLSFLNLECGGWIDRDCDGKKLQAAYEKIINIPQAEINNIIGTIVGTLKSIECQNGCQWDAHYQYIDMVVKDILVSNHNAIETFLNECL